MQSPGTSCLLSPNIFLSTKFTKALNLCSSRNKKDQLSQPHRRTAELHSGIFLNNFSVIHFRMFRTKKYLRILQTTTNILLLVINQLNAQILVL